MRYVDYGYRWAPLELDNADAICDALRVELRSWEGTPYGRGQQCKGVAVDCVRFLCGVLDAMYGLDNSIPRLPQDMAMHDHASAIAAMRYISGLYPHEAARGRVLYPGDAVIVGERKGGPGHALIVGPDPNSLWQAGTSEVHRTGISFSVEWKVHRVYRMLHKDTWAR